MPFGAIAHPPAKENRIPGHDPRLPPAARAGSTSPKYLQLWAEIDKALPACTAWFDSPGMEPTADKPVAVAGANC